MIDANYWDSPKISPRLALTWCWRSPYTRWSEQSRWKRAASSPTKWPGSGSSSHWASKGRSCCERLQHFHGVFLIFPGWTGGNHHHGCICIFRKLFHFYAKYTINIVENQGMSGSSDTARVTVSKILGQLLWNPAKASSSLLGIASFNN